MAPTIEQQLEEAIQLSGERMLKYFSFAHLPDERLREVSKQFAATTLAVSGAPNGTGRSEPIRDESLSRERRGGYAHRRRAPRRRAPRVRADRGRVVGAVSPASWFLVGVGVGAVIALMVVALGRPR